MAPKKKAQRKDWDKYRRQKNAYEQNKRAEAASERKRIRDSKAVVPMEPSIPGPSSSTIVINGPIIIQNNVNISNKVQINIKNTQNNVILDQNLQMKLRDKNYNVPDALIESMHNVDYEAVLVQKCKETGCVKDAIAAISQERLSIMGAYDKETTAATITAMLWERIQTFLLPKDKDCVKCCGCKFLPRFDAFTHPISGTEEAAIEDFEDFAVPEPEGYFEHSQKKRKEHSENEIDKACDEYVSKTSEALGKMTESEKEAYYRLGAERAREVDKYDENKGGS